MNYNNEKYALLENGYIEPLYYNLNKEIKRGNDNSRLFYKDEKGNWYLTYNAFCGNYITECKRKIIKFGNTIEDLLKQFPNAKVSKTLMGFN